MVSIAASPFVHLVESKQKGLLARLAVNEFTFLHIGTHQLITPPREEHILGPQVMVVSATEVQILQCEKLLCRHWKCYDC